MSEMKGRDGATRKRVGERVANLVYCSDKRDGVPLGFAEVPIHRAQPPFIGRIGDQSGEI